MAKEKQFETKVKTLLKEQKCYFIKYWGGGQFTKAGIPDIICCCAGKFIGVELKAPNGKPSELQIYNLKKIEESGGYGILLYPHDYKLFTAFISALQGGFIDRADYFYNEMKGARNCESVRN